MKISILFRGGIICLLLLCCLNYQPVIADNENPRYHYDVKIMLISRIFESIEIDGYHDEFEGYGNDDLIDLKEANRICIVGFLLIYNDSGVLEQNYHGGWIHTNIEITGFLGWMINQHNNNHVLMIGNCDIVKLTTGRG